MGREEDFLSGWLDFLVLTVIMAIEKLKNLY